MPEYTYPKLDPQWDAHVLKFRIWYLMDIKPEVTLTPTEAILSFDVALLAAEETQLNTIMANANAGIMPTAQARFALNLNVGEVNQALRAALPGKKIFYIGVSHEKAYIISLDALTGPERQTLRTIVNGLWTQELP